MPDTQILVQNILSQIGEDPNRLGLKNTPERVVKMYGELFAGYNQANKPKITTFPNGEDGLTYDELIIDTGEFASMCEHHMIPFFGSYVFAYIPKPDGQIVGLSKIKRVVDYYGARLQVQERLVTQIVDELEQALDGKVTAIGLIMKATHLCKVMRGTKSKGEMITSCLRGKFKEDCSARNEFLQLAKTQLQN